MLPKFLLHLHLHLYCNVFVCILILIQWKGRVKKIDVVVMTELKYIGGHVIFIKIKVYLFK